jgi:hypothetical protein
MAIMARDRVVDNGMGGGAGRIVCGGIIHCGK